MAGRHPFQLLRDRLSPEVQLAAAALTDAMERQLSLAELRRARAMTQEQLAADLHVGQASIAKLERRTDMYLSTLRRFVEAMGGELDIVVRFPDQPQVRLRGIGELGEGGGCAAVAEYSRVPSSRLPPGSPQPALGLVEPRFDQPVEFLEFALAAGVRHAAFQPTQHVSLDQLASHARVPRVDARHRLLDRQPCPVGPDDHALPGVNAGMCQCIKHQIRHLDRLLSLRRIHPIEKALDGGIVLEWVCRAPLAHGIRITPPATAVARLTTESSPITMDSTLLK